MFRAALLQYSKTEQNSSVHQLINRKRKCGVIHTMKYYLAIKRNGVLMCATAQANPEDMLSKRSQAQENTLLYDSMYMKFSEWTNQKR